MAYQGKELKSTSINGVKTYTFASQQRSVASWLTSKNLKEKLDRSVSLRGKCGKHYTLRIPDDAVAMKQVRFQPQSGKLLATASGNGINLFDVETGSLYSTLKGHVSGKYIVSVNEESAQVWSTMSGGKSVHELHANGNEFQSYTFHPGYSNLSIVGGYQFLELWNPTESSKTLSLPAHNGWVSALAESALRLKW